jgi:hypothetical protein
VRRLPSLLRCLPALLAAAVIPATLPAAAQDAATPGYSVRGTVVNAISGQAIGRALVSFDRDRAMLTASDGGFAFDNVPAGEYSVSVQKPGYQGFGSTMGAVRYMMGGGHNFESFPSHRVQVGPDMPALTFRIMPLAMITGHVTLSTADPADGIMIQVYGRQFHNGRAQWMLAGTARTRSDGSFRIADLEPGHYMLSTQPSIDRPAPAGDRGPVWGFPSVYYPGVADVTAAGVIALAAGQQAEADSALVRQQFFPVTALVHSNSEAAANFQILDSSGRPSGLPASLDRREGVVRASLPNGNWTMEGHSYGRNMQWGSTNFQVNSAPVSIAINIVPIPTIPVSIRREFLASTGGSTQPEDSGPGMNLQFAPADETNLAFMGGGGMNQVKGNNSQWQITVNQPGRYWIEAQAFPPAYIASITAGGVDLGSNPLTVMAGSTPPTVEVTLRNDSGTITGEINSQAASGAAVGERPQVWIYAIPLFSTAEQIRSVMPNPDGHFSFYGIAPGSYRVVACDSAQEIDFHTPEGLAAWSGKGQTISVEASSSVSVQLDVLHVEAVQ